MLLLVVSFRRTQEVFLFYEQKYNYGVRPHKDMRWGSDLIRTFFSMEPSLVTEQRPGPTILRLFPCNNMQTEVYAISRLIAIGSDSQAAYKALCPLIT